MAKQDAFYTVHYMLDGTETKLAADKTLDKLTFGETYTETAIAIPGYTLKSDAEQTVTAGYKNNEITFWYTANTDTEYTVEHWFQNVDGDDYTQSDEYPNETLKGTTGTMTAAVAQQVEGFTAQAFEQQVIAGDDSTVVNIYYNRNTYTVTYEITGSFFANPAYQVVENVRYGAELSLISDDMSQDGYTWSGWSELPETMPAHNVVVSGSYLMNIDGSQINVSDPAPVVYDGGQHEWEPVVTDASGKTLTPGTDYTVSYSDDDDFVNVDDNITVTITGIGNYTGSVDKTYQITPDEALLVVGDSSKVYGTDDPDGYNGFTAMLDDQGTPLHTNVLTGELDTLGDVTVVRPGMGTDENVDVYADALSATVENANPNYTYTVVPGDFTIIAADDNSVTIDTAAEDRSKVYDGQPITIEASASEAGSTLLYTTNPEDPASWSTEKPSLTNVGTLTIYVKATNPNYEDSAVVSATVQVTTATITVTTPDAGKVYDGTPLTAEGEISGLVNGETAGFDTTGTRTEVGSVENSYAITFAADGNEFTAQQGNYTVDADLGTLTVFPQSIDPDDPEPDNPEPGDPDPTDPETDPDQPFYTGATVEFPGDVTYNGSEQKQPVVVTDGQGKVLTEGVDYTVDYSADMTNVGTVDITVTGIGQYAGEIDGSYKINPAELTVTTASASKIYDGTALTKTDGYTVDGLKGDDQVALTFDGFQLEAGQSENTAEIGQWINTEADNYTVEYVYGTLTVFPQSIDPDDPDPENPEPDDPDPTDPDPGNPDQPFYTGIQIDSPADVPYNGEDQTWAPTVTDRNGNPLTEGEDYTVSYSTDDRTNVTGEIVVTITGIGDYAGEVERSYQVTPLTLTVTANNQTKVAGTADPALTSTYTGALPGETPGWTGTIARVPGEAAGTYQIFQNTLGIEDNGAFLAGNYTLVFVNGTLTITAAPGGGDNPGDGGDDTPTTPMTPTTPGTTTDGGTPTVIEDAPEQPEPEQIDDDENPLAGPSESIDDDGTPLARPTHQDCWVHWLMILGIIVTAIYDVMVLIRRRKFTGTLASFEDGVLNDRNRNA